MGFTIPESNEEEPLVPEKPTHTYIVHEGDSPFDGAGYVTPITPHGPDNFCFLPGIQDLPDPCVATRIVIASQHGDEGGCWLTWCMPDGSSHYVELQDEEEAARVIFLACLPERWLDTFWGVDTSSAHPKVPDFEYPDL